MGQNLFIRHELSSEKVKEKMRYRATGGGGGVSGGGGGGGGEL